MKVRLQLEPLYRKHQDVWADEDIVRLYFVPLSLYIGKDHLSWDEKHTFKLTILNVSLWLMW